MGFRTIVGLDLGKFKSVCCAVGVVTAPGGTKILRAEITVDTKRHS